MSGDAGGPAATAPWSKDIIVRLYNCLQRYPFRPEVRSRAVEHVRKSCLQLVTADDFKELGKELSEIIRPVRLIEVLQVTCNTSTTYLAPSSPDPAVPGIDSNPPTSQPKAHKRRRQETEAAPDAPGTSSANPTAGSSRPISNTLIKPEPIRWAHANTPLPMLVDSSAANAEPEPPTSRSEHLHLTSMCQSTSTGNVVQCLLNLVESLCLSPEQVHNLIRGLEGFAHGHKQQSPQPQSHLWPACSIPMPSGIQSTAQHSNSPLLQASDPRGDVEFHTSLLPPGVDSVGEGNNPARQVSLPTANSTDAVSNNLRDSTATAVPTSLMGQDTGTGSAQHLPAGETPQQWSSAMLPLQSMSRPWPDPASSLPVITLGRLMDPAVFLPNNPCSNSEAFHPPVNLPVLPISAPHLLQALHITAGPLAYSSLLPLTTSPLLPSLHDMPAALQCDKVDTGQSGNLQLPMQSAVPAPLGSSHWPLPLHWPPGIGRFMGYLPNLPAGVDGSAPSQVTPNTV